MDEQGLTRRGLQMEKGEDWRKMNWSQKDFVSHELWEIAPSSSDECLSARMLCAKWYWSSRSLHACSKEHYYEGGLASRNLKILLGDDFLAVSFY